MLNSWGFCKMSEVTSIHSSHEMITHASKHKLWPQEWNVAHYQNSVNKVMISRPQLWGLDWWRHPGMCLTCLFCTMGPKNKQGETRQVIWKQKVLQKGLLVTVWFLPDFSKSFASALLESPTAFWTRISFFLKIYCSLLDDVQLFCNHSPQNCFAPFWPTFRYCS